MIAGLDREAALAVLWHFGDPAGRQPGTFTEHLLQAMSYADLDNQARLVAAFPELGAAFLAAKTARDGIERLRDAAGVRHASFNVNHASVNVNHAPVAMGFIRDGIGRGRLG